MASPRRFELIEGTSRKFWEIDVDGAAHTIRFGRIGTTGQQKAKAFATVAAATADAAKLIKEKVSKGYREVATGASRPASASAAPTAPPRPTASVSVAPARPIAPAPAAPAPTPPAPRGLATRYTLTAAGRAPMILTHAGTHLVTNATVQTFPSVAAAKEHLERVIGLRKKDGYAITEVAEVADDSADAVAADDQFEVNPNKDGRWIVTFRGKRMIAAGQCEKILDRMARDAPRVVQIACDLASPGAQWASAISGRSLRSIDSLIFDTDFLTQTRQSANSLGDLAVTLDAMPALTRVFATGGSPMSRASHPALRELYLLGDPLSLEMLDAIGAAELPALERLALSLVHEAAPGPDLAAAAAALRAVRAPRLREVHVNGVADVAAFLEALAAASGAPPWKVLTLSGFTEDAPLLGAIGLPFVDEVSSEAEEVARARLPQARDVSEWPPHFGPSAYKDWQ
jgi:predicted DNA-binding WGR domain protein